MKENYSIDLYELQHIIKPANDSADLAQQFATCIRVGDYSESEQPASFVEISRITAITTQQQAAKSDRPNSVYCSDTVRVLFEYRSY